MRRLVLCVTLLAAGLASAVGTTPARATSAEEARTESFRLQSEGMRLFKEGRYRDATEAFQQVVNLNLNSFLAYYYLGASLVAERRYSEAVEPLKIALDLEPDYLQAHMALGKAYMKLGDASEARAEYLRALELQPNYAGAHDGLGQLLESIGEDGEAEAQYRRALSINIADADAYTHLGDLYLRKDRLEDAIELFLKAISIKPDFSRGYTRLGTAYARKRMYNEAIAATRRSQWLAPLDPEPYVALAGIYLELESHRRAESEVQSALGLDHDHPGAHLILSDLKRSQADFDAAEEVLQGLHERGIEDAQMRRAVEEALERARADSQAHGALLEALAGAPENPAHVVALARFLSEHGSHLRAADLLLEAAALAEAPREETATADPSQGIGVPDAASSEEIAASTGDSQEEIVTSPADSQDEIAGEAAAPPQEAPAQAGEIPQEVDPLEEAEDMAADTPGETETPIGEKADSPPPPSPRRMKFEAALEFLAARRHTTAIALFESLGRDDAGAGAVDPLRAAALFNVGVARADLGLDLSAAESFLAYLDDHPDDPMAHLYLGNAYLRLGRKVDARASYTAFLERARSHPEAARVESIIESLDEERAYPGRATLAPSGNAAGEKR